jgi:hypothetical protein
VNSEKAGQGWVHEASMLLLYFVRLRQLPDVLIAQAAV